MPVLSLSLLASVVCLFEPTPLPVDGVAPLGGGPSEPAPPADGAAPPEPGAPSPAGLQAPLGAGPDEVDTEPPPRALVRLEILFGMVWRIKTTEPQVLATVEAGRRPQGLAGTFHVGAIIAPDRRFVAAEDYLLGAGFVARRQLGKRSIFGSIGLSAGLLIHRASTEFGVVRRVDPDLQLPLRFLWDTGPLGLSVALLQGFSFRTRTYERRGTEIWKRIPYRIGITVGLHFDFGVGPARARRAARRRSPPP